MSSPIARRTTGGPDGKICDWPFTITVKCDISAYAAGAPATEPRMPAATGTFASNCACIFHCCPAGSPMWPGALVGLRAVAHALHELDVGDAVLEREWLGELARALVHVVRAAAGDREVVAADRHRAAVDLGEPHHIRARHE